MFSTLSLSLVSLINTYTHTHTHKFSYCFKRVKETKDVPYERAQAEVDSYNIELNAKLQKKSQDIERRASELKGLKGETKRGDLTVGKARASLRWRGTLVALQRSKRMKRTDVLRKKFKVLETRRKFLGLVAAWKQRHRSAVELFLNNKDLFDGKSMSSHLQNLYDENGIDLPMLRRASAGDLVSIGIPLGNALLIVSAIETYPDQAVDAEKEPDLMEMELKEHEMTMVPKAGFASDDEGFEDDADQALSQREIMLAQAGLKRNFSVASTYERGTVHLPGNRKRHVRSSKYSTAVSDDLCRVDTF